MTHHLFAARRAGKPRRAPDALPSLTLALALGLALSAPAVVRAQEAAIEIDIAQQPLSDALLQLGRQTPLQFIYASDLVRGLSAPPVHGRLTPEQALRELLRGSPIRYTRHGDNVTLSRDAATTMLPAVTVVGAASAEQAAGYVATASSGATKSDTPLIKTPQAISVVTREQMEVQNTQSVPQALRYTSGITPEQRGTNTDSLEYLYIRGFQAEEYLNGLRLPGPGTAGYNITSIDPYLLERIEVLHGPSSVLYGQGSPGGMVNLVSKAPTDEPVHEVGLQTGNHGRIQAFFDLGGPADKDGQWLYRITGDAFDTSTQTDHVREQRVAIAPSLTWRPSGVTKLTLFASYQADPKAGSYNFVPVSGTAKPGVVPFPRNLDPGDPSFDSFHRTQESVGYAFEHRFNDTWSFKQNYRYLHNKQTIKYVSFDSLSADGLSIERTPYLNSGMLNSHTLDNQLGARFDTGPLAHKATVGLDYQRLQYDHSFLGSLENTPPLVIGNPQYGQSIPDPDFMFVTSAAQSLRQLGLYAQDQVDLGKWSFLAGIREDWVREETDPYKAGNASTRQSDRAFTWRAGGVYQFDNGLAPYVSYSRSFLPSIGTDYSGKSFVPTTGKQYEAGLKYQPKGYNSFVTVSAFHLDQNNVSTTDPEHAGFSVQTGQVRSRGIELEGHASLSNNLQLIASYTLTDLVNTESNTVSKDKTPVGIPRNAASLWADYTLSGRLLAGLQLGAGVRYVGSTYGDVANTFKVPSATLLDLAVRYDLGRSFRSLHGWMAAVNVSNVTDRRYLSWCSGDTCNWGQGRLALASLKYRW